MDSDARRITALYVYQVARGCEDGECDKGFCRRNVKRQFCGRTVSAGAVFPLACHLTRLYGEEGLCHQLRRGEIDVVKHVDLEKPAMSPVLLEKEKPSVDKPRAAFSLPRSLHGSQAFEHWPSYAAKAVGTGTRWFQYLKRLLTARDRDDARWYSSGVFALTLDREAAAHFVETADATEFSAALETLHDLLGSQARFVSRHMAAAFGSLYEYLVSRTGRAGDVSEGDESPLYVSWGRGHRSSAVAGISDGPRVRVVELMGVACLAAGPYKPLLEVSLPAGGLDALTDEGHAVHHFPNAVLRGASRYGKKTRGSLVVRSSLGDRVVVANGRIEDVSGHDEAGIASDDHRNVDEPDETESDTDTDREDKSNSTEPEAVEPIEPGELEPVEAPEAADLRPRFRLAFLMTASLRQLLLWPQDVAHTGPEGSRRLQDVCRATLNNPELRPLAAARGPASLQRYFRRYPNTPGRPAYLAATPWLLRQHAVALFKYGCLRQMAASLRRVESITVVMYDLRALLRQDDGVAIRPITYVVLDVDRGKFLASAVASLSRALLIENAVRRPLRVRFDGEEAVDEGGLQVEFFQAFGHLLTHSGHGFFVVDDETHMAYLNPGYTGAPGVYEYLGMLFALGVYNGCIIDVSLPLVFYDILRTLVCGADPDAFLAADWDESAVAELHPTLARSLGRLRELSSAELDALELSFDWTVQLDTGEVRTEPLLAALADTPVTADNVGLYIRLYVAKTLYLSVGRLFGPFAMGFRYIVSDQLLSFLSSEQLRKVVEGTTYIDVSRLKAVTQYDGFSQDSPTVRFFWDIVFDFDEEHKGLLLEFVTGSRRVPVGGMDQFSFVLQRNGTDTSRLPSASVCFSRLLMPEYTSRDELKKMLLLALDHSKGFGLM